MRTETTSPPQIGQRLRVGAIGLAAVVLLILLAGALARSVTRDRAVAGGAAGNAALVNEAVRTEPLADMGVSPAADNATAR